MKAQETIIVLNEFKKLCKRNYIDPTEYIKVIDIGIDAINNQNKLINMLRKCNPFIMISHPEAKCVFCNSEHYNGHKDDCIYVDLTLED